VPSSWTRPNNIKTSLKPPKKLVNEIFLNKVNEKALWSPSTSNIDKDTGRPDGKEGNQSFSMTQLRSTNDKKKLTPTTYPCLSTGSSEKGVGMSIEGSLESNQQVSKMVSCLYQHSCSQCWRSFDKAKDIPPVRKTSEQEEMVENSKIYSR
ncbi:hypothetical protein KI387_008776, partial [Taxus chinensis]